MDEPSTNLSLRILPDGLATSADGGANSVEVGEGNTRIVGDRIVGDRIVDERWDPPVTLGARLVSVVNDDTQHVGQAAYVKGLLGA